MQNSRRQLAIGRKTRPPRRSTHLEAEARRAQDLPVAPPSNYELPEGRTDFLVNGLTTPDVTIRIFSSDLTGVTGYAKFQDGAWVLMPTERVSVVETDGGPGGYVEVTITDGGVGDDDNTVNSTIVDSGGIVRVTDAEPPTVEITGVQQDQIFELGDQIDPQCVTSDAGSGVATEATLSIEVPLHQDAVGQYVGTCSGAVDNAGNVAPPVSVTYQVRYILDPDVFTGGSVRARPFVNTGRAGRTFPIRWTMARADGSLVDEIEAVDRIDVWSVNCDILDGAPVHFDGESTTVSGLAVNGGVFKYNYRSEPTPGCIMIVIGLVDGGHLIADFELR